ncbi:adenine phosphoribosyltransferase-like [Oppia nitens]|uniref:adenine phosphoribosyltransferase-like n=1 Tax=Oppia nitens TaxID=1686743 RepID=UPI0023DA81D9|nr:adenine phosphoribosyltransferase-like [Oppia nitens]
MSNNSCDCDNRLKRIKDTIKSYTDFPKKGILFRDFFPVLRNPDVFKDLIDLMAEKIKNIEPKVEAIVGLESRGFLLGAPLALLLKIPFIPVRKPGKLAGLVNKSSYTLEYGSDSLEIQTESITNGLKCVVVDDLIATGGSLKASIDLVKSCGGHVVLGLVVIELVALNGRSNIPSAFDSLIQY